MKPTRRCGSVLRCAGGLLFLVLAAWPAGAVEADLDVTHVERTPKYNYDGSPNAPTAGQTVTFHGYVRYWGDASSAVLASVPYQWKVDGQVVASGALTNVEPLRPPFTFDYAGYPSPTSDTVLRNASNYPKNPDAFPNPPPTGLRKVTFQWTWQPGRHTIAFVVDPDNTIAEKSESNNAREDFTDAILASFWVEETTWRYFHLYQNELGVGSNSWEDWAQRQMAKQNELYQAAVYDGLTPNAIITRVRIDRIIVVPDEQLPVNGGLPTNNPDSSDKTIDLQWGFEAYDDASNSFYDNHTSATIDNPFFIEQSLIHELGHARYLIDSYGFNVHDNDPNNRTVQIYENGEWIVGTYLPWVWTNDMVYQNKHGGVMTGPYGFVWGPYEAAMLQRLGNARACCGNMNSPGNIGIYLQELPQNNWFQFTDDFGVARPNVSVRVYQATGRSGVWYGKTYDGTPDLTFSSDASGVVNFGRNPFTRRADGTEPAIQHTYGLANSVMIIRVEQQVTTMIRNVWYRFVECSDFNLEYFRGHTQNAYYTLPLDGPNIGDVDGDGLPDDWEMDKFGDLEQAPGNDPDADGLNNGREHELGTEPLNPDTDDDGLLDGDEVFVTLSDPLNPDVDDDDVLDGADNCIFDANPDQRDGDEDGLGDACDPLTDCNGNGLPDADDVAGGASADCNANGIPDECDVALHAPALVATYAPVNGWLELVGNGGTPLSLGDETYAVITMPFTSWPFSSTTAIVHNNGGIGFGTSTTLNRNNQSLPHAYAFNAEQALLPFWDDLDSDTGNVYWGTVGTAPDRTLVVEWYRRPHNPGDAVLDGDETTFEVQIFESPTNDVSAQFLYADTDFLNWRYDNGMSATIGYQGGDGTANVWAFNLYNAIDPSVTLSLYTRPPRSLDLNGDGVPDECQGLARPGDLNCDGHVDFDDIKPFVVALGGEAAYIAAHPDCRWLNADTNGDGAVDFDDIKPFVGLIGS